MRLNAKVLMGGRFHVECTGIRDEDGKLFRDERGRFTGRRVKWVEEFDNVVVDEGLDHILNTEWRNQSQISTWYVVLFDSDTTPDGSETYATPVFTEVTTEVDEATRDTYDPAAPSSQTITNSASKGSYTFNTGATIYGAAILGGGGAATTKGDTAGGGTLSCAGRFASSRGVVDDDVINITYSIGADDDGV